MRRGKIFALLFLGVVFSMMFINIASGQFFGGPREVVQSVIDAYVNVGEPILQALFGGFGWNGLYLFERLLLFILLISIVYLAVGRIPLFEEQRAIRWVIAIIVPLIGMRFVDFEWLNAIFLSYTILAIILTAVIPFLLIFFFIYNVGSDYGALRKIMWLLFIGIYAGLWTTSGIGNSVIYGWTTVAAIACLVLDNTIMRRYRALQLAKGERWRLNAEVTRINEQIRELNDSLIAGTAHDRKATQSQIRDLERHKKWLLKQ